MHAKFSASASLKTATRRSIIYTGNSIVATDQSGKSLAVDKYKGDVC
jgi:hypothetical protein